MFVCTIVPVFVHVNHQEQTRGWCHGPSGDALPRVVELG